MGVIQPLSNRIFVIYLVAIIQGKECQPRSLNENSKLRSLNKKSAFFTSLAVVLAEEVSCLNWA
jgi:hypothetical protein